MPASLYEYCRKGDYSPLKVGQGVVLPTDRQTQDYLLCSGCEDILNKGGESWIADKLATWERSFPLYDLLTKQPPGFDDGDLALYSAARNPEIRAEKLEHFALGLFWKASVHSWSGTTMEPRIDLGPYAEGIRKWLLCEAEFPEHMYLLTIVSRPSRAQIVLNDPFEGIRDQWRNFVVHVPGLLFMLAVGKTVDESVRLLCIHNNPGNPIAVADSLTDQLEQLMAQAVQKARKTKAYMKSKAKYDAERRR